MPEGSFFVNLLKKMVDICVRFEIIEVLFVLGGLRKKMEYRSLMRQFSSFEGYEGYVIIKVRYERRQGENIDENVPSCVEKKKRNNYAVLEEVRSGCRNIGAEIMQMHVMKPVHSLKPEAGKAENLPESACFIENVRGYTKQEVLDFVEEVKDFNSIHREGRVVVPGLLILEQLLLEDALWKNKRHSDSLEIVYRSPLFAKEPFSLYHYSKKGYDCLAGWTNTGNRRLLFELSYT